MFPAPGKLIFPSGRVTECFASSPVLEPMGVLVGPGWLSVAYQEVVLGRCGVRHMRIY
mgnify:CR=1 FL=1|jgi:hypothetical protein